MSVLDWNRDPEASRDRWRTWEEHHGVTFEFVVYELGDDGTYEFWVNERDTGVEVAHGWSRSQLHAVEAIRVIVGGAGKRRWESAEVNPKVDPSAVSGGFMQPCPGTKDGKPCVRELNHRGQCLVAP